MENSKRFIVRLELGMAISIGVEAENENDAENYAKEILNDKLCAPGNSDVYFCEIDDSDVYVNCADVKTLEIYEDEEE